MTVSSGVTGSTDVDGDGTTDGDIDRKSECHSYGYGNSNEDSHIKLEYDLYYVKHASPLVDTKIILQTIPVMLLGKGT